LLDDNPQTYWATDDSVREADIVFDLPNAIDFNLVQVREAIALGQRIGGFSVEYWKDGAWASFGTGASIGSCRILRSPQMVNSNRVRLKITESEACPALSEFGLFAVAS
jgi:alpha-L-fucosidase